MIAETTRRALIGGAGIAAVTLAAPTVRAGVTGAGTSWAAARDAFLHARRAELAHEAEHIHPVVPDHLPIGAERNAAVDSIPAAIWAEANRLTEHRCNVEDVLMDIPSPDGAAFAFKYLVAHGGGRETDGWNGMLEQEAARLCGYPEMGGGA